MLFLFPSCTKENANFTLESVNDYFPLQVGNRTQQEHIRENPEQVINRRERDNGGSKPDQRTETVYRHPENKRVDQMRGAAEKDECDKKPDCFRKGEVFSA